MSDDNVVDFRTRDQVPRQIEPFRSAVARVPWEQPLPLRIDPNVNVRRLMLALASVGIVFKLDERTGSVVLMPAAIARQEESERD